MDPVEKRVLGQMRPKLVEEVVVTESFLCAFCDSNVLDEPMTKLLKTETNYENRASKLLDLLPKRGPKAFPTLMEILEVTNPWLAEKMKAALHEERLKDAKLNAHSSLSQIASIEGYGQTRIQIDPDIKNRATAFVKSNLNHLTEVDQRGVEKWLTEELQRERRRQQFKAPHNPPRQARDFHASKETQTETTNMELIELYEDILMYLHGSNYVEMTVDFSFQNLHKKVKNLLRRTRKMDAMFLNCLEKFDDPDKYSASLTELIDRAHNHEKELIKGSNEDKQFLQKVIEERDMAQRQVTRLEEELDTTLQKLANLSNSQKNQMRYRYRANNRYASVSSTKPNAAHSKDAENAGSSEAKLLHDKTSSVPVSRHSTYNDPVNKMPRVPENFWRLRSILHYNNKASQKNDQDNRINNKVVVLTEDTRNSEDGQHSNGEAKHGDNAPCDSEESAQRVHPTASSESTSHRSDAVENSNHHNNSDPAHNKDDPINDNATQTPGLLTIPNGKIRRHASEESLKIALSKEDAEITCMSSLNLTNGSSDLHDRKTVQDTTTTGLQFYNIKNDENSTNQSMGKNKAEVQSRTQHMHVSQGISNKFTPRIQRSESDRPVRDDSKPHNRSQSQDTNPVFKGNPSLKASYESIVAAGRRDDPAFVNSEVLAHALASPDNSTDTENTPVQSEQAVQHPLKQSPRKFLNEPAEHHVHEKHALQFESSFKGNYHPGQQAELQRLAYPSKSLYHQQQPLRQSQQSVGQAKSKSQGDDQRRQQPNLESKKRLEQTLASSKLPITRAECENRNNQQRSQSPSPNRKLQNGPKDFRPKGNTTSESDTLARSAARATTSYRDLTHNRVRFASPAKKS